MLGRFWDPTSQHRSTASGDVHLAAGLRLMLPPGTVFQPCSSRSFEATCHRGRHPLGAGCEAEDCCALADAGGHRLGIPVLAWSFVFLFGRSVTLILEAVNFEGEHLFRSPT